MIRRNCHGEGLSTVSESWILMDLILQLRLDVLVPSAICNGEKAHDIAKLSGFPPEALSDRRSDLRHDRRLLTGDMCEPTVLWEKADMIATQILLLELAPPCEPVTQPQPLPYNSQFQSWTKKVSHQNRLPRLLEILA